MKPLLKILVIFVITYLLIGIIFSFTLTAASPYGYDHSNSNRKYIDFSTLVENIVIWPLYLMIRVH